MSTIFSLSSSCLSNTCRHCWSKWGFICPHPDTATPCYFHCLLHTGQSRVDGKKKKKKIVFKMSNKKTVELYTDDDTIAVKIRSFLKR